MKKTSLSLLVAATAMTAAANSPFIATVHEFCPAPGQFINSIPEVTEDMTADDVVAEATRQIAGDEAPGMISLGAFGGYVIFSFDHPLMNVAGECDFKIYGNAVKSDQSDTGGSSEPGIVMVSADENGDGVANDTWYELKGSEWGKPETFSGFKITYHRPAQLESAENIRWTSNEPTRAEGSVGINAFHTQTYWPLWLADRETLEFTGTRLPDNAHDRSGDGSYWILDYFDWGYVDNQPDYIQDPAAGRIPNPASPGFNLDNAVDADGNPVALKQVDFIKVYTAVNQTCGWIGETSTEVCGARDLHPDANTDHDGLTAIGADGEPAIGALRGTLLAVNSPKADTARIYTIDGRLAASIPVAPGMSALDLGLLPSGPAIVRLGTAAAKVQIP